MNNDLTRVFQVEADVTAERGSATGPLKAWATPKVIISALEETEATANAGTDGGIHS